MRRRRRRRNTCMVPIFRPSVTFMVFVGVMSRVGSLCRGERERERKRE